MIDKQQERSENFADALCLLEQRALKIQLEHFKIPPEERGRVFYALELTGETGELLNDCKKYIRTNLEHRKNEQVNLKIPEETADALISLMMLKHAAQDKREITPQHVFTNNETTKNIMWLHTCLSGLALSVSSLYVQEVLNLSPEADNEKIDINMYKSIIEILLKIAVFFNFDLEEVTNNKLTNIIKKVQAGYYD